MIQRTELAETRLMLEFREVTIFKRFCCSFINWLKPSRPVPNKNIVTGSEAPAIKVSNKKDTSRLFFIFTPLN
ncbi:MAG: hypothetical protein GY795_23335 [Desulfobacterales bacterium]|nr:hypothetical protein [Desulfobacterales bacterium]